jgi:hypothetical protein
MRTTRSYDRLPDHPTFRLLAKKRKWPLGWNYYVTGRSVQGHFIVGEGKSAAAARRDLQTQRR